MKYLNKFYNNHICAHICKAGGRGTVQSELISKIPSVQKWPDIIFSTYSLVYYLITYL